MIKNSEKLMRLSRFNFLRTHISSLRVHGDKQARLPEFNHPIYNYRIFICLFVICHALNNKIGQNVTLSKKIEVKFLHPPGKYRGKAENSIHKIGIFIFYSIFYR